MADAGEVLARRRDEARNILGELRMSEPVSDHSTGPELRNREALVGRLRRLVIPYEVAKERHLYCARAVRAAGGSQLVRRANSEKHSVEQDLVALRWLGDRDEARNRVLDALLRDTERLLLHEEVLVAHVAAASTPEEWSRLGERLLAAQRRAPTRGHPDLPSSRWVVLVTSPFLGAADRFRDGLDPPPEGL